MSGRCVGAVAYDLESGEYEILYSVPAESYLDRVIYLDGSLYFIETYYAERKNLINTGDDADWFYFTDTETGAEGVTSAQDISTRILPSDGKKRCIIPRRKKNRQAPAAVLSISEITENTNRR